METFIDPDELFTAIQNFEYDGIASEEAILNMVSVMDRQAKAILSKNGLGVHQDYLTGDKELDDLEWVNEALHLLDYNLNYPFRECAMLIVEAGNARLQVEHGQDKLGLAMCMTKLIALSLLPNEVKNYTLITRYKKADEGRVEGRKKGGKTTAADRKSDSDDLTRRMREAERRLRTTKTHGVDLELAEIFGVTPRTIRNHRKKVLPEDN